MWQFSKRIMDDEAHKIMVLWWYRIVPYRSYVKGWKISPSHYVNQDLANVWLDKPEGLSRKRRQPRHSRGRRKPAGTCPDGPVRTGRLLFHSGARSRLKLVTQFEFRPGHSGPGCPAACDGAAALPRALALPVSRRPANLA